MSEQAGLSYGDASDADDTSSDTEDGGGALRTFVPALRANAIAHTDCVQREARLWHVRPFGDDGQSPSPLRRTVRRRTMTKYEFARMRGLRVAQLEHGAMPLVPGVPAEPPGGNARTLTMCERIFEEEARRRRLPYIVKREYHDGKTEYIQARRLDYSRWLQYEA